MVSALETPGVLVSLPPLVGDLEQALRPMAAASDRTRNAFLAILLVVAVERLFEVWLSRRNARRVLARGGREAGARHFPVMVALHTAFLVCAAGEVLLLPTDPRGWLTLTALLAVAAAMALRYWAILSLGDRWNTRVLFEPGREPVTAGPYRWLRHPNYVAVVVEIAFLPLVHGAWRTALVFSVANAVLLRHRVRVEEAVVYGGRESGSGGTPPLSGASAD